jgi:hypothetical protein
MPEKSFLPRVVFRKSQGCIVQRLALELLLAIKMEHAELQFRFWGGQITKSITDWRLRLARNLRNFHPALGILEHFYILD